MKKKRLRTILLLLVLTLVSVGAVNWVVGSAESFGEYALAHPETVPGGMAARIYRAAAPSKRMELARSVDRAEQQANRVRDDASADRSMLVNPEWLKRFAEARGEYDKHWETLSEFGEQMEAVERKFGD